MPLSSRHEDIWARLTAGDAVDASEERELLDLIAADADLRGELLADVELDGLMAARAAASDGDSFVRQFAARWTSEGTAAPFLAAVEQKVRQQVADRAPPARHSRWRWPWFVATAGLAAAAILVLVARRPPQPTDGQSASLPSSASEPQPASQIPASAEPTARTVVALVDRMTGAVDVLDQGGRTPARVGTELSAGQGLVTRGPTSTATLAGPDGTVLQLGPDTVVAQLWGPSEGRGRLFLARGRLTARIGQPPEGRAMVLTSPHAHAQVTSARLSFTVTAETTRIDVDEGRVLLAGTKGDALSISAGRYGLVGSSGEVTAAAKPRGGVALLVIGAPTPSPADALIAARLAKLGFEVRTSVPGTSLTAEDARQTSLVLISSSTGSSDVDATRFRELAVPLLTWEANLYDDLGMTESCESKDCGNDGNPYGLLIKDPSHPLAAGQRGTVSVHLKGRSPSMNWGTPNVHAAWIATMPGRPTNALIFAYERGVPMPGLVAPARRVGMFMGESMAEDMSEIGWALFEAAVVWCAGGAP